MKLYLSYIFFLALVFSNVSYAAQNQNEVPSGDIVLEFLQDEFSPRSFEIVRAGGRQKYCTGQYGSCDSSGECPGGDSICRAGYCTGQYGSCDSSGECPGSDSICR